jgi:hypothetical protein
MRNSFMLESVRAFAFPLILLAVGRLPAFSGSARQLPKELKPPAHERVLLQVHAKGDQIYSCKADGAVFAWTLNAPDAQLMDKSGKPFGKHSAGPSWEANDGSRITGKAVANAPAPASESIPWLLVSVVSRSGEGVLTRVTSVQRVNTKGGKAPAYGCDGAHVGHEVRVPYSADYVFFAPK